MKAHAIGAVPAATSGSTTGDRDPRQPSAEAAAQYRLVIEQSSESGRFIYKIMDRVTGEVVRQLPREQVIDLIRDGAYQSGRVINTIV